MSYPNTVDSFTTKTDGVDDVMASHVNDLQTSIVNTQTELGTNPRSIDDTVTPGATPASVAAYLDMIAKIVKTISGAANWYSSAVAAIMKSIGTTKGDVIVFTGNGTPVRLGVGSNTQVLTADSSTTEGVKWAAGGGGSTFTNSSIAPTTTDTTLTVNYRYLVDASGLTADRSLKFPTGAAGDQIEIIMTGEHASYACILKGDTGIKVEGLTATEWDRLWHTGMALRFVFVDSDGWRLASDNRKIWRRILATGDVAYILFDNIPNIYKDIEVDAALRSSGATIAEFVHCQMNGDTTAVYDGMDAYFHATNLTSVADVAGQTSGRILVSAGASAPTNHFSACKSVIPDYTSLHFKSWVSPTFVPTSTSSGGLYVYYIAGQWRNASPAAISSIKFFVEGGSNNIKAGSSITITLKK